MAFKAIDDGRDWRERVDRLVSAAIAAGTHTDAPFVTVCPECRQWRPIYHKTLDGRLLCWDCTPQSEREKDQATR